MKNHRFVISSKQLIFIIIGAQVGTGILSLPRLAAQVSSQDAWLVVLLGAVIPLLSLLLIERLGRQFPGLNFVSMTMNIFGKYFGAVLVMGFVLYVLIFQGIVVRVFAEISSILLLPETPEGVIVFIIVLSVVYVASQGATVVGRVNEFLFYVVIVLLLTLIPSVFLEADYINLMPVGETGIVNLLKGSTVTTFAYAGGELLLVYYFMVNRKEDVLKACFTAIAITASIYVLVTLFCLLVFGYQSLQNMLWPVLALLKVNKLMIIERIELVFLTFWLGLGARPTINLCCAASHSLVHLFNLDEEQWYVRMVRILGLGFLVIGIIPSDMNQVFAYADMVSYGFFLIAIVYPVLYLVVAFFRGKGGCSSG